MALKMLVYNRPEDCLFCPIVKAGGVYYKTFEIPISLNLKIPINHSISIGVLGGFGLDLMEASTGTMLG